MDMQKELWKIFNYHDESGLLVFKVNYPPYEKGDVAGKIDKRGYRRVNIFGLSWGIHKLVWIRFNGNLKAYQTIHHKNFIPWDNRLDNLQAVTTKEHARLHSGRNFTLEEIYG